MPARWSGPRRRNHLAGLPLARLGGTTAGLRGTATWQQLPVPEPAADADEADSTLGSSMRTVNDSTASLSSSILEYRTVHGRSYASDRGRSEVWEPSDEKHLESMDMR